MFDVLAIHTSPGTPFLSVTLGRGRLRSQADIGAVPVLTYILARKQAQQAEAAASAAYARQRMALMAAALAGWRAVARGRHAADEAVRELTQRRTAQLRRSAFAEWRALLQVPTEPNQRKALPVSLCCGLI